MSNRLFPSTIQSVVSKAKVLAISFAPQGTSAPIVVSPGGVASVVRNSAGNFTVNLQNQFRALIDAQVGLQLASAPAATPATYTWTDSTDSDSVTFSAGTSFVGLNGNSLKVVVATGSSLSNSIATSAGVTTVTITIDTTVTTPALLATYVNTTAAATLAPYINISAHSGTTAFTVFLSSTALTGGASGVPVLVITGANVTSAGTGAKSVTIQAQDASTGAAIDISANAGNLINLELFVKDAAN